MWTNLKKIYWANIFLRDSSYSSFEISSSSNNSLSSFNLSFFDVFVSFGIVHTFYRIFWHLNFYKTIHTMQFFSTLNVLKYLKIGHEITFSKFFCLFKNDSFKKTHSKVTNNVWKTPQISNKCIKCFNVITLSVTASRKVHLCVSTIT